MMIPSVFSLKISYYHYCDRFFESITVDIPSENPIVTANLPLVLDRPRRLRLCVTRSSESWQFISHSCCRDQVMTQEGAENVLGLALTYRMKSKQLLARGPYNCPRDASLSMDLARTLFNIRGGRSALLSRGYHFQTGTTDTEKTRTRLEILAV
jgi:hypothetical protein